MKGACISNFLSILFPTNSPTVLSQDFRVQRRTVFPVLYNTLKARMGWESVDFREHHLYFFWRHILFFWHHEKVRQWSTKSPQNIHLPILWREMGLGPASGEPRVVEVGVDAMGQRKFDTGVLKANKTRRLVRMESKISLEIINFHAEEADFPGRKIDQLKYSFIRFFFHTINQSIDSNAPAWLKRFLKKARTWNCLMLGRRHFSAVISCTRITWMEWARARWRAPISRSTKTR